MFYIRYLLKIDTILNIVVLSMFKIETEHSIFKKIQFLPLKKEIKFLQNSVKESNKLFHLLYSCVICSVKWFKECCKIQLVVKQPWNLEKMVNGREEKLKSIIFGRSLTEITLGTKEVTLSALLARYLMMVWWVSRFYKN